MRIQEEGGGKATLFLLEEPPSPCKSRWDASDVSRRGRPSRLCREGKGWGFNGSTVTSECYWLSAGTKPA
jgi:hypothetical protein